MAAKLCAQVEQRWGTHNVPGQPAYIYAVLLVGPDERGEGEQRVLVGEYEAPALAYAHVDRLNEALAWTWREG